MNDFPFPFPCGFASEDPSSYCTALNQLIREHSPLREQMDELSRLAQHAGENDRIPDWTDSLNDLKEKVLRFKRDLDPHSEREEGSLFPMMVRYIGRESGPIAVMEYEHQQGKKHLESFIRSMESLNGPVSAEEAKNIASSVLEARRILSQHFMKEEKVLFPLAERLLSQEEKDLLAKKLQT